jgi:NAD(P)-dependent dehydrogenase (short-subunit alcohol dehydrogenase family)
VRLKDRVAIITGAGSGIGAESARRFVEEGLGKTQVLGKIGDPVVIGNAAVFLASDEAGFITGHAQVVDGRAYAGEPWARQGDWITTDRPIKMYRPEDR